MNKAILQEESDIDDSSRAGMQEQQEGCCAGSFPDRKGKGNLGQDSKDHRAENPRTTVLNLC